MGSGYAGIGSIPLQIEGKDGDLTVRSCWTSANNYVELAVHDPDRDKLYCMQMSDDDAKQLIQLLLDALK